MAQPLDESAHQTYPASVEEVSKLSSQAQTLARSRGKPVEFAPHMLSFTAQSIAQELIPAAALPYLQLTEGGVDCIVSTNVNTGRSDIRFRQLALPDDYPGCIFTNSVEYDLTGEGFRTAEATITNTRVLMKVPNPDHPSDRTRHFEQAEAQQLGQMIETLSDQ